MIIYIIVIGYILSIIGCIYTAKFYSRWWSIANFGFYFGKARDNNAIRINQSICNILWVKNSIMRYGRSKKSAIIFIPVVNTLLVIWGILYAIYYLFLSSIHKHIL
jgi:hypothetical protein